MNTLVGALSILGVVLGFLDLALSKIAKEKINLWVIGVWFLIENTTLSDSINKLILEIVRLMKLKLGPYPFSRQLTKFAIKVNLWIFSIVFLIIFFSILIDYYGIAKEISYNRKDYVIKEVIDFFNSIIDGSISNIEANKYNIMKQKSINALAIMDNKELEYSIKKSFLYAFLIYFLFLFIYSTVWSTISLSITHFLLQRASNNKSGLSSLLFILFDITLAVMCSNLYMLTIILTYILAIYSSVAILAYLTFLHIDTNYHLEAIFTLFSMIAFIPGAFSNPTNSPVDHVLTIFFMFPNLSYIDQIKKLFIDGWYLFYVDMHRIFSLNFADISRITLGATLKNWTLWLSLAPTIIYISIILFFIIFSRAEFLRRPLANLIRWVGELEKGLIALCAWVASAVVLLIRFLIN